MKFATFNLFQFVAPGHYWFKAEPEATYTPPAWQEKLAWIQGQLQRIDADVVGFQEVFSSGELESFCHRHGYPHFATVDVARTMPTDPTVYQQSVVAIASRWPLSNIRTLEIDASVRAELRLEEAFRFSRWPVCADIEVADIGKLTVCVVHLKSKRSTHLHIDYPETVSWRSRSLDTLLRISRSNVLTLTQRSTEATLLYHAACHLLYENQQPLIILGDLNDDIRSDALAPLTMPDRVYTIGGIDSAAWPEAVKGYLHDFRFGDAFRLAPNMRQQVRPFTHIHHGVGNSIDHILLSNQLNPYNPKASGEIINYQVFNEHLNQDGSDNQLQSDHGQLCIEIQPIRDLANQPVLGRPIHSISRPLTRQDFIDLAGGIYQSNKHYRQWSSQDKYDQFWSFFFDNDYGWVKSIYGRVPVDELRQKQLLSIEHLIPLNFLDEYLLHKSSPRHVRYGATVNPFNLAPSERHLNAKRSSFPFDMDGDKVVRPYQLTLDTQQTALTGLDADHEWVIPNRSRGSVARSLLYMLLVYGIDELYEQHINTLIHWAKLDTAADWELAYNQWVYTRLGIRNPLVDKPAPARELLDNAVLMHSMLTKG